MSLKPSLNRNCYEPVTDSDSDAFRREFDCDSFDQWLDHLANRGAAGMLLNLVLKLERLGKAPLAPARRLAVMHRLIPTIRDLSQELPKLPGATDPSVTGQGPQALDQRLWCLAFRNLKRTLLALDAALGTQVRDRDLARHWTVDAMFECLNRQGELSYRWAWPLPAHTWQEAHDLFSYYEGRLRPSGAPMSQAYPPEIAYKRLLLVGLIAARGATALLQPPHAEALDDWARRCQLHDANTRFGAIGAYLVESSKDEPPRMVPGSLGPFSRAWVLELPEEMLAALKAERTRRVVFDV